MCPGRINENLLPLREGVFSNYSENIVKLIRTKTMMFEDKSCSKFVKTTDLFIEAILQTTTKSIPLSLKIHANLHQIKTGFFNQYFSLLKGAGQCL